jgi:hypothetical protein
MDEVKENFQALFRREPTIILRLRLVGFGEGVKYAGRLFHPLNISWSPKGNT